MSYRVSIQLIEKPLTMSEVIKAVEGAFRCEKDSSFIGVVGAGIQAVNQMMAIKEVLPQGDEVKVYDVNPKASTKLTLNMKAQLEQVVAGMKEGR